MPLRLTFPLAPGESMPGHSRRSLHGHGGGQGAPGHEPAPPGTTMASRGLSPVSPAGHARPPAGSLSQRAGYHRLAVTTTASRRQPAGPSAPAGTPARSSAGITVTLVNPVALAARKASGIGLWARRELSCGCATRHAGAYGRETPN